MPTRTPWERVIERQSRVAAREQASQSAFDRSAAALATAYAALECARLLAREDQLVRENRRQPVAARDESGDDELHLGGKASKAPPVTRTGCSRDPVDLSARNAAASRPSSSGSSP